MLSACSSGVTPPAPAVVPRVEIVGDADALLFMVADGYAQLLDEGGTVMKKAAVEADGLGGHSLVDRERGVVYYFAGNEMFSISLDSLEATKVATIPRPDNPCLAERLSDNLQARWDFLFAEGGGGLCIRLMDRNVNTMDTEVTVFVSLVDVHRGTTRAA